MIDSINGTSSNSRAYLVKGLRKNSGKTTRLVDVSRVVASFLWCIFYDFFVLIVRATVLLEWGNCNFRYFISLLQDARFVLRTRPKCRSPNHIGLSLVMCNILPRLETRTKEFTKYASVRVD